MIAAALLGAILGFAPFNKPVARLFLGDVGSLPIGLLLGWLLLRLAGARPSGGGAHPAALLSGRCHHHARAPHRQAASRSGRPIGTHFYQRATDNGFTVPAIVARVFLVNLASGGAGGDIGRWAAELRALSLAALAAGECS